MKKLFSCILLASLLVGSVSCGGDGEAGNDTTTVGDSSGDTTTVGDTIVQPKLPDKKYDGATFVMFTKKNDSDQFITNYEEGTDIVDDAVYNRNRTVEELYGITIERVNSENDLAGDALKTILANEDAYDVVACHGRTAFTYAQEGAALDWLTDLPWVDLDAEWWAQDAKESFTIKGKLYTMTGDISYGCLGNTKTMFFNMNIFDEMGWEYPYQLVRDGEWTLAKMNELVTQSAKELNGDDTLTIGDDRLGFATTWWGTPVNVLFTAGQRICDIDKDGSLILTLNNERTVDVYDTFLKLMKEPGFYLHKADDATPIINAFKNGNLTFYENILAVAGGMRDMNDDFGLIPVPKFDDAVEDYITGVDAATNLFIVPITVSDPEYNSAVIEALAYYGWRDVIPTYYEVALSDKFMRDEASVEMLDIIRGSRMFDIGYYQGALPQAMSLIGFKLAAVEGRNFASYYAANEAEGLAAIKAINEFYED